MYGIDPREAFPQTPDDYDEEDEETEEVLDHDPHDEDYWDEHGLDPTD